MNKDISILVGGFLSSLLLFLSSVGIKFEWFTQESIDSFTVLLGSIITLAINFYAVWKNTYVSKKGKEQKEVLEKTGLK